MDRGMEVHFNKQSVETGIKIFSKLTETEWTYDFFRDTLSSPWIYEEMSTRAKNILINGGWEECRFNNGNMEVDRTWWELKGE